MKIVDRNGTEITVGDRVLDENNNPEGTVTELIEQDGDVNDQGRPVSVGPFVVVQYDDGQSEKWTARWNATGPWDDDRDDFTCDDVEVAR